VSGGMFNLCPFCPTGGQPALNEVDLGIHAVICQQCGCTGPIENYSEGANQSPQRAAELWNNRTGT
jgi:hypothetical protein